MAGQFHVQPATLSQPKPPREEFLEKCVRLSQEQLRVCNSVSVPQLRWAEKLSKCFKGNFAEKKGK
jgi:hypothetical protein